MNNKVKQVLVLLFVVSTLLLMIGSVSANTDNLNENLEASDTLNDDLSVDADSVADKDVSNQLTISNDENINGSSQSVGESDSNVVSNYEDTTIDAKDSDNNIIKASDEGNDVLSAPNLVISITPSSSVVNVGDVVNYDIIVRNTGDTFNNNEKFIGIDFLFDANGFDYVGYTPCVNPDNGWDLRGDFYPPDESGKNNGFTRYAYNFANYGGFLNNFCFEFIVSLKAKNQGTYETNVRMSQNFGIANRVTTIVGPKFNITNTASKSIVNIGDEVDFEVIVRNIGASYYNNGYVGVNFNFNPDEFEYVRYTPCVNPDNGADLRGDFLPPNENGKANGFTQYAYSFNNYGGFHNNYCFKFIVTLKVKSFGALETTAQLSHSNQVSDKAGTTSKDSELVITNTAIYPNVNRDGEASFEVYVINNGGTYTGMSVDNGVTKFVGIDFDYDANQLEYIGYSYDTPSRYLEVRNNWWDNNVQFAYNTYGAFKYGESFKFTVTFKVKSTGTLATNASIVWYNAQKSIASVNAVNPPQFVITNVASLPISNTGDNVAFEVTVKNNGDTFYPTYILGERFVGVNFWYDPDGLTYQTFTTSDNPSMYLTPRVNPAPNNNLVQFAYKVGNQGFANGDTFKFKAIFNVKKHGTFDTNAQITQFVDVTSKATTDSMDANIEITNTALNLAANIGDNVAFEVTGKNVGGTFRDNLLGIGFDYNDTQLEYQSYTPNSNSDKYDLGSNPNPNYDMNSNGLLFGYDTSSQKFYNGDIFNFTVTFKVLEHGIFETTAFWWQNWGVKSTAQVISNDTNIVMFTPTKGLTMKVGDNVYFTYTVQNLGGKYDGTYIGLDVYFDADKMEYLDFTQIPNLNLESIEYTSTHGSEGSLALADGFVLGADSSVGHLKLGYTSDDGFDAGSSFNFDVQFKALTDGKLQSSATLNDADSKYTTTVYGYTFAGDPSFMLTKTADNQFVNIGDPVSYEIILENNGTLQYTENDMIIYIHDYYPEGLQYMGYTINAGKDGVKPILHIDDTKKGHVSIKYDLIENGMTEGWAPGSTLNITLHFNVTTDGIICNHVFSEWNTSDVSSVVSGEPEINLTKKCLNSTVEIGDLVYYEIYLENTGDFDYFDHATGGVVGVDHLIIEDIYPDGLEYVDYIPNPDKRGNIYPTNYIYVGPDGDNRVIVKYRLWNDNHWSPGDSLNVTLIFRATDIGKLTNKANFYWLWDDTITGSGNSVNLTDESDVVVGPPTFSLDKISNYQEAKVGDIVSFSVVYSNTGNRTITGAYIKDNTYSQGLEYYDFSDKELWTFDGKDTWYYNSKLEPGESVTLKLFFKALTVGKKSNTARAGHNMNNDTMEDTDTVLIKEGVNGTADTEGSGASPDEPEDEPDEEPSVESNSTATTTADKAANSVAAKSTLHEAGNPLFVLLLSLLTLCFVQRKGKE